MEEGDDDWEEVIVYSYAATPGFQVTDIYNLNTSALVYEYRVIVQNMCGDYIDTTNIGRTMVLEGVANTIRLVNTITWTNYGDWESGPVAYRVHRSMDKGLTWIQLDEITGNVNFYEDDVSSMLYTPGEFCYRIEAVEGDNSFGLPTTAMSNELCLTQEPKIWVPNAFITGGFNNTWRPVISFADLETYLLIVYDRVGNGIFESTDPNESWDGTYKGEVVQDGSYAFYLGVRDGEGRLYETAGHVLKLNGD
jgi:gliding motility-associated-like protein